VTSCGTIHNGYRDVVLVQALSLWPRGMLQHTAAQSKSCGDELGALEEDPTRKLP